MKFRSNSRYLAIIALFVSYAFVPISALAASINEPQAPRSQTVEAPITLPRVIGTVLPSSPKWVQVGSDEAVHLVLWRTRPISPDGPDERSGAAGTPRHAEASHPREPLR